MTYCQITATSNKQKIKIVEIHQKFIYFFFLVDVPKIGTTDPTKSQFNTLV